MPALRILYLGDDQEGCTALHRAAALRRIGHEVTHVPTKVYTMAGNRIAAKFHYRTGYAVRQRSIHRQLSDTVGATRYDVAWVDSGAWCGANIARFLKSIANRTILLNLDDPTGKRDTGRWNSLRKAIGEFDLCAVVRPESQLEFKSHGAKNAIRIWRGYDEIEHSPLICEDLPAEKFRSDVAFIGTRFEDRHRFMIDLIKRGVPLSIWGNGWKNGPGWQTIRPHWRGDSLAGSQYVAAIAHSKICLGLLSKGNRDQHTTRSSEIPFAGGLLCAERTQEHLDMYCEGTEAVFWKDADECATVCKRLLITPALRRSISDSGRARVLTLGVGNEQVCQTILDEAFCQPSLAAP